MQRNDRPALVIFIAEVTGYPLRSVRVLAQVLGAAKIIASGGRGLNGAKMSIIDAAWMLAAVCAVAGGRTNAVSVAEWCMSDEGWITKSDILGSMNLGRSFTCSWKIGSGLDVAVTISEAALRSLADRYDATVCRSAA